MRKLHPIALERMDSAITMLSEVSINEVAWPYGTPPSIVVVREDQYAQSMEFCRLLSMRGIVRFTYLLTQLDRAKAFCDQLVVAQHR